MRISETELSKAVHVVNGGVAFAGRTASQKAGIVRLWNNLATAIEDRNERLVRVATMTFRGELPSEMIEQVRSTLKAGFAAPGFEPIRSNSGEAQGETVFQRVSRRFSEWIAFVKEVIDEEGEAHG